MSPITVGQEDLVNKGMSIQNINGNGTPEENSLDTKKIPKAVIKRLSLYKRVLKTLEYQSVEKVSSADLAARLGLSPAQVRKDLAFFGQFGVPGVGYYVSELQKELRKILGKGKKISVALIGIGNLGSALISYGGFQQQGVTIRWGFDIHPEEAKKRASTDVPIYPIQDLESKLSPGEVDIAVISVPGEQAQAIADRLVKIGIRAILNFVPVRLKVPADVQVRYVDLSLELESLSYYVNERK